MSEAFELVQASSIQALERAAVDSQVATAHMYPRSLADFRKRGLAMSTLDLETAQSCIYQRPVGKGEDGKQKIAEGESIRMAEIVAASFGNLRVGARIIEQTPQFVRAEGVAHDLESNYAGKSEVVESTVDRKGRPYSERQRTVVAKAALSKAYRDAIFKVVPRSMCKFIRTAAEQVIRKEALPLDQRRKRALAWAKEHGVEEKRFFAGLGIKGIDELGEDQLITLTGIRTAIKDGDTTPDEAFPELEATSPTPPPTGPTAPPPPNPDEAAEAAMGLAPETKAPKAETVQSKAETNGGGNETKSANGKTIQVELGELCSASGVSFDDFKKLARSSGWEADWDSMAGFEEVPQPLTQSLMASKKFLARTLAAWKKEQGQ